MGNRADNFNRTASSLGTPSDGGSAWVDVGSQFSTAFDGGSGQTVAYLGTAGSNEHAYLECSATDHQVSAEIIQLADQAGVSGRVADDNNYYYWFADSGGTCFLYKKVSGSFTLLATGSGTFTPGAGNTISLKCQGTTITGYIGASVSATVTDSSLSTGTNGGMRSAGPGFTPYYDNFSITDLSGGGGGSVFNPYFYRFISGGSSF